MSRLPELSEEELSPEQQEIYRAILASRGHITGPFRTWLHSPEFARRAQHLGEFARYQTSLEPRLSELAILMTARSWSCQVEWSLHEPCARQAGLDPGIIDAIRARQEPEFARVDEKAVYHFAAELLEDRLVQDPTFRAARDHLGAGGVVELTGILGYYTLVAMTLNAFQVPLPDEVPPGLDDSPVFS